MNHDSGVEANASFRSYLQRFELSLLDVALAARVRLLTVWRLAQGLPVREADAQMIRAGLLRLTGVPYSGQMALIPADQGVRMQA